MPAKPASFFPIARSFPPISATERTPTVPANTASQPDSEVLRVAISGATGGIGSAVARRFRQSGAELVLIDLEPRRLDLPRGRAWRPGQHHRLRPAYRHRNRGGGRGGRRGRRLRQQRRHDHPQAPSGHVVCRDLRVDGRERGRLDQDGDCHCPGHGRRAAKARSSTFRRSTPSSAPPTAASMRQPRRRLPSSPALPASSGRRLEFVWLAIAPGPVESPMTAEAMRSESYRQAVIDRMPVGRFLNTTEIAEIIHHLCNPTWRRSSATPSSPTAAVRCPDGGRHRSRWRALWK